MRLSTKSRVAVSAMLYLASQARHGPSNANDICRDQDISVSYLEQLFAHLRRHGLVEGVRGPGGGYRLGRPAGEISIAQIVIAVDDHAYAAPAAGVVEHSAVHGMWQRLSARLYGFLNNITLAEAIADDGRGADLPTGRAARREFRAGSRF